MKNNNKHREFNFKNDMKVDTEVFQKMNRIAFEAKTLTYEMDRVLGTLNSIVEDTNGLRKECLKLNEEVLARGICPKCKSEYTTYTSGDYFECSECDYQWTN